jgi:hypothetical protein
MNIYVVYKGHGIEALVKRINYIEDSPIFTSVGKLKKTIGLIIKKNTDLNSITFWYAAILGSIKFGLSERRHGHLTSFS